MTLERLDRNDSRRRPRASAILPKMPIIMTVLGRLILAFALYSLPLQASEKCSELLNSFDQSVSALSKTEILKYQHDASLQITTRDLNDYLTAFKFGPLLTKGRMLPDFHWLDVGGGAGIAALQSFITKNYHSRGYRIGTEAFDSKVTAQHKATVVSYENLFEVKVVHMSEDEEFRIRRWKTALNEIFEKQTASQKFNYMTGRLFEDIADSELAPADLITDFFGAFSYSQDKIEVVKKMIRRLKPGGKIFIWTNLPYIETMTSEGEVLSLRLNEFLKQNPIPGVLISGSLIMIDPVVDTLESLERLEKTLIFHRAVPNFPPQFYYRVRDPLRSDLLRPG